MYFVHLTNLFGCMGGKQALKNPTMKIFGYTIMIFSNMVGPAEEISFFGHQISYIAANTLGAPQVLSLTNKHVLKTMIKNLIYK